jgi:hypothetical protein
MAIFNSYVKLPEGMLSSPSWNHTNLEMRRSWSQMQPAIPFLQVAKQSCAPFESK